MTILDFIYKVFIGPLELFFEVVFALTYRTFGDPVIAIVLLSLAMNILVLPLYRRADAMQEEARDRTLRMKPWADHIKKAFTGDERFMMMQAYNRQNNYKQTDVLKGSISLLLEIPFFIAAFHFLSNLELLNGVRLGPIADLGAPDALLQLGGLSINLLPILMTLINVVSAAIYLKGFPLNSKIQTYGIAAIFLVLLYASPAGLVFYWTLNNLFSLGKNILYKVKNPKRTLYAFLSLIGMGVVAFALLFPEYLIVRTRYYLALGAALQIPLVLHVVMRNRTLKLPFSIPEATSHDERTFIFGCLFFTLLTGALIPLSIIQDSPAEFVVTSAYSSPLWFVAGSLALAIGTFCIWFGVFYHLATPRGKTVFGFLFFAAAATALVNYLFFGTDYGNISSYLQYDYEPSITVAAGVLNAALMLALTLACFFIWRRWKRTPRVVFMSLGIAVLTMSIISAVGIEGDLAPVKHDAEAAKAAGTHTTLPHIPLSKNGKNVVIIMLDRAVPGFVPFLVHEKPELKERLSGFTVYNHTVSYGTHTNVGVPALWGGPDYRPARMNERAGLSLCKKHNEALTVLPRLFSSKGYKTTIFDPPYANYRWTPDLSIYDGIANVDAYRSEDHNFYDYGLQTEEGRKYHRSEMARSFFCFSLFRISPLALQPTLYQNGGYNSTKPLVQVPISRSTALGTNQIFMASYAVLEKLSDITQVTQQDGGTLLMLTNNSTHEATFLQEPAYTPAIYTDNTQYDADHDIRYAEDGSALQMTRGSTESAYSRTKHYQINMASFLKLADWCDYLKQQGVYDNTRIILVSDHSWPYLIDDKLYFVVKDQEDGVNYYRDMRWFNCLLMVKDFNSTGFSFSDQFMTNADVPSLALQDIIASPKNPYTGNALDQSYKDEPEQYLLDSKEWSVTNNNGNTFLPGDWYSLRKDPSKKTNWKYLGYY